MYQITEIPYQAHAMKTYSKWVLDGLPYNNKDMLYNFASPKMFILCFSQEVT